MMDEVVRWGAWLIAGIGAIFGYGHLHSRVSAMEHESHSVAEKLDRIQSTVSDIRERVARIEGPGRER